MKNDLLDDGFTTTHRDFSKIDIVRINDWKIEANDRLKQIRQGQYFLFFLAFLALLGLVIALMSDNPDVTTNEVIIESVVICLIYLGAALLIYRHPMGGLTLGLGFYLLYQLILILVLPEMAYRGFIWKIVVIAGLGRSAYAAYQLGDYLEKLQKIGIPASELDILRKKFKPLPRTLQRPGGIAE